MERKIEESLDANLSIELYKGKELILKDNATNVTYEYLY
jgi:hypothetical protein